MLYDYYQNIILMVRVWTCSKSVDSGRVIMCATLWAGAVAHTIYL